MSFRQRNNKKNATQDNRIRFIMAVVFLLGATAIYKLYDLQIRQHGRYVALAQRQQQGVSTLLPKRGRVFIQDSQEFKANGELFPLATNKQFATIYAKPSLIKDVPAAAEALYSTYNQKRVEREIDDLIANDPTMASSTAEFRQVKKELELRQRKEKIINEYLAVLGKKDDPYVPISKKVEEEEALAIKALKIEGLNYDMFQDRYYPERNVGSHVLGFLGYMDDTRRGRYGLEGFFERELSGSSATMNVDKSASGDAMLKTDQLDKVTDGSDLILTINRSVQFETCRLLKAAVDRHGANGGSVVIMEPKTGAIIAMCAVPDFDPNNYREVEKIEVFNNPVIFDSYEPGSTFKAITMAAAVDQVKVGPNTTYTDKGYIMVDGWPKPIKNSDYESKGGHGVTSMNIVLQDSLNTGSYFAMQSIGAPMFAEYLKRFGFGEKTGIELETETAGNIISMTGKKIKPVAAATASFGQGITATPIQMINSYAVIANGGMLMKPFLVKAIISPDGGQIVTQSTQVRRVISNRTATLMTGMLVNAVENGHAKRAKVPGYYVAGKTGTAQVASKDKKGYGDQTIQTFIGYAPANSPKFVMLTRLDDPKDSKFAESSAVPLFGEIATFVLNYYQVPQERKIESKK
ncbi:penicillin-binding protein 2 [Candidatus Falkowbacteria bacterium]|nr:penicillin-binding protein 2 [Candidatus Falkowbacteria bacterium]